MKFTYTVKDLNGKTITGVEEAHDQTYAINHLQEQGYFIVHIEPVVENPQNTKIFNTLRKMPFTHNAIKLDDLLTFARQLATMLESGVHLLRSLDVIVNQIDSKKLHEVISEIKKNVQSGNSFSASLAKHPKVFNQFWVSLIEVGEASGTMPNVLEKLVFYLEQRAAFQSALVSAIIYPLILLIVAMGAVLFFAIVIGPQFKSIFNSFHVELPLITKLLLAFFDIIKTKFFLIVLGIGGIVVAFRRYTKQPSGRLQFEKLLFRLPKVGYIFKAIVVERFTSQMAILVESGVPILYSLDICQRMIDNKTCEAIIAEIKNNVREGKLLAQHMSESDFFPPLTVQMILIGEETGELGKMLKRVAEYYQDYVQTVMKRFGIIFEPIMLVFMGAIIGVIVVAMFLPIFSIAQLGGGQ